MATRSDPWNGPRAARDSLEVLDQRIDVGRAPSNCPFPHPYRRRIQAQFDAVVQGRAGNPNALEYVVNAKHMVARYGLMAGETHRKAFKGEVDSVCRR